MRRKDGGTCWVRVKTAALTDGSGEVVGTVAGISSIQREKDLEHERDYLLQEVILSRSTNTQFEWMPLDKRIDPVSAGARTNSLKQLRQQERELILAVLEQAKGRIHGEDRAAALLGMRPTTLS